MWFDALNERGRLKISFLALFVSSTVGFVGLAMFQTVFGGYVSPWWLIAGFFLWLLVMMPTIFGMARLQRRASTENKEFVPVGHRYVGSILLVGTLLLVLGLVGILLEFSIGMCVAEGGCESLPPEAVAAFLASLVAGVALLVVVFVLAMRGVVRSGGARNRGLRHRSVCVAAPRRRKKPWPLLPRGWGRAPNSRRLQRGNTGGVRAH